MQLSLQNQPYLPRHVNFPFDVTYVGVYPVEEGLHLVYMQTGCEGENKKIKNADAEPQSPNLHWQWLRHKQFQQEVKRVTMDKLFNAAR